LRFVWLLLPAAFLSLGTIYAGGEFIVSSSTVSSGIDYLHLRSTNQPWSIHVARLDRSYKEFEIDTTLGKHTVQGLASLSAQASSLRSLRLQPLAGVNGDFFLMSPGPYQGDPKGLQIIKGELVSGPTGPSFWRDTSSKLHLENVTSHFFIIWPDKTRTRFGLNETPHSGRIVLFTPIFGASTRHTNGWEIILERDGRHPWLPLRANADYRARVREIVNHGDNVLREGILIVSAGSEFTNKFSKIKQGDLFQISTAVSPSVKAAQTAVGGGPVLVSHGREQQWPSKGANQYLLPRHPRTALGWNNKYFFLVQVDGRQKDLSIGMSFAELAHLMKDFGCTEAMNLDGGGSSTFWLNGKIMNSPSDKRERPVANAVVISHREVSGVER
jgi:exopolysaccharide biosynthesis protein